MNIFITFMDLLLNFGISDFSAPSHEELQAAISHSQSCRQYCENENQAGDRLQKYLQTEKNIGGPYVNIQ